MAHSPSDKTPFKNCPFCDFVWESLGLFLKDPDVVLIGYQTRFKNLTDGLFYFNHSCKSSMVIPVDAFTGLYNGPVFKERKTGEEGCPGYCLYKDNLEPCPNECECAYVREVIQIIKERPK